MSTFTDIFGLTKEMEVKEKEKKEDKKKFVEPELVKHEEKLDEVTMSGDLMFSPPGGGMTQIDPV